MARPRATTTEAVIDAAAALFLEHGYHKTSIEDVAEAAGISKPTVYQYVKSKQWLLDQIILRVITELSAILEPWGSDTRSLDEQFDDYLAFHIEKAIRLRVFYRILYSEETEMSHRVRRRWHRFATDVTDHFVELLELFEKEGRIIGDVNLRVIANMCVPVFVTLHRWYQPGGAVPPEQLRETIKQLLSGVVVIDPASG